MSQIEAIESEKNEIQNKIEAMKFKIFKGN
jgi:hypothetical protein